MGWTFEKAIHTKAMEMRICKEMNGFIYRPLSTRDGHVDMVPTTLPVFREDCPQRRSNLRLECDLHDQVAHGPKVAKYVVVALDRWSTCKRNPALPATAFKKKSVPFLGVHLR